MSLLKKLVGLTIGAAAVGAAAYFLNRNEHTEEYEHIVGPEDEVETDSAEPAEDASAAAETPAPADPENEHIWGPEDEADAEDGTAETAKPADDASAEAEEAPAAPEETAAAPVEEAPEAEAAPVQAPAGDDTPNANPVELGAVEVPKTEDGKLDVTKIADPADFGDWDEQGCKG